MTKASPTAELLGVPLPNVFALNLQPTTTANHFIRVHFLSKLLDFADTIFIVLRKKDKQLSFLHVYHHSTIGGIWGLLVYLNADYGTAMFGAAFNSLTHVFMYTHYLLASFNIHHPFKAALTSWQIFQFYSCFAHAFAVSVLGMERVFPRPLSFIQFFYQLSMILLFSNFYKKTYGGKKQRQPQAEDAAAGEAEKKEVKATAVVNGTTATPTSVGSPVAAMHDAVVRRSGPRLRATTA